MTVPFDDVLVKAWKREEARPFSGWDFSYLDGRMCEERPPWSYTSRATELMAGASSELDMGTTAGERFLKLREHWPAKVAVTEEYAPSLALARQQLEPLGVSVFEVELNESGPMLFGDGEYDLVLTSLASRFRMKMSSPSRVVTHRSR